MGEFVDLLICWIQWGVWSLVALLMSTINAIQNLFVGMANLALSILPNDEGPQHYSVDSGVLGVLNYVIPVGLVLDLFGVVIASWIVYRTVQWILAMMRLDY